MMYFRHVELMAHLNPFVGAQILSKSTVRTIQRQQFIHRNIGLDKIVKSEIKLLSKTSYFCVLSRRLNAIRAGLNAQWLRDSLFHRME
jgi:hypothetical protein